MCDMYGHCLVDVVSGEVLRDYMCWNSHAEIALPGGSVYQRQPRVPLSMVSPEVIKWKKGPRPGLEEPFPRYCNGGIDPVDGRACCNDPYQEILGFADSQNARIRASWDYEIPTIEKMCEWFDAHFGKREDLENWLDRGPLLLAAEARRQFCGADRRKERTWRVRYLARATGSLPTPADFRDYQRNARFSATELIDAFRKHPNEYWERSRHEKRRDAAARVLDEHAKAARRKEREIRFEQEEEARVEFLRALSKGS